VLVLVLGIYPAGVVRHKPVSRQYITVHQARGCLLSYEALPHQIILFGDRWHVGVNNLPKITVQQCVAES